MLRCAVSHYAMLCYTARNVMIRNAILSMICYTVLIANHSDHVMPENQLAVECIYVELFGTDTKNYHSTTFVFVFQVYIALMVERECLVLAAVK